MGQKTAFTPKVAFCPMFYRKSDWCLQDSQRIKPLLIQSDIAKLMIFFL